MNSRQLAFCVQDACEEKKGIDPLILDIRKLTDIADYFLLVNGTSDRHVKSIAEGIHEGLIGLGIKAHAAKSLKGFGALPTPASSEGAWVLLDMGDVVAHVFEPQARAFYGLEHLWQDAPKVKFTKS